MAMLTTTPLSSVCDDQPTRCDGVDVNLMVKNGSGTMSSQRNRVNNEYDPSKTFSTVDAEEKRSNCPLLSKEDVTNNNNIGATCPEENDVTEEELRRFDPTGFCCELDEGSLSPPSSSSTDHPQHSGKKLINYSGDFKRQSCLNCVKATDVSDINTQSMQLLKSVVGATTTASSTADRMSSSLFASPPIASSSALDVVRQMVGLSTKRINSSTDTRNGFLYEEEDMSNSSSDESSPDDKGGSCVNSESDEEFEVKAAEKRRPTNDNCVFSKEDDDDLASCSGEAAKNNNNFKKSLAINVDLGVVDVDFCGDSSLGSSTSCSDDSFEMGAVDEFEKEQRRYNNNVFIVDAGAANNNLRRYEATCDNNNSSKVNNGTKEENCIRVKFVERDSAATPISESFSGWSSGGYYAQQPLDDEVRCRAKHADDQVDRSSKCGADNNNADISSGCSTSCESFTATTAAKSRKSLVDDELSKLDTFLPEFDFDKLEKQLADAAQEREMSQRKLMSEAVRRRLAMDSNEATFYPPAPTTRPMRSNLATRLQTGMNLQICFMNDTAPSEDDTDDDDECWRGVPKSSSTPNLRVPSTKSKSCGLGRSVSNGGDSEKRASDLRKAAELQQDVDDDKDFEKRRVRLESETKLMLLKAKQAAHMQMELEKQSKMKKSMSSIEEIIGVPLGRRKLSRTQLTKMCITQLLIIINDMHSKIETHNEELVHLLIERDNLHMEQDSMLVDVEDLLQ